jgi:hypothetical protein
LRRKKAARKSANAVDQLLRYQLLTQADSRLAARKVHVMHFGGALRFGLQPEQNLTRPRNDFDSFGFAILPLFQTDTARIKISKICSVTALG